MNNTFDPKVFCNVGDWEQDPDVVRVVSPIFKTKPEKAHSKYNTTAMDVRTRYGVVIPPRRLKAAKSLLVSYTEQDAEFKGGLDEKKARERLLKKYPGVSAFLPMPAPVQQQSSSSNAQFIGDGGNGNGQSYPQSQSSSLVMSMLAELVQSVKEVKSAMPVIQSQIATMAAQLEHLQTGKKAGKKAPSADKVKAALGKLGATGKGGNSAKPKASAKSKRKSKRGTAGLDTEMADLQDEAGADKPRSKKAKTEGKESKAESSNNSSNNAEPESPSGGDSDMDDGTD